jgi:hypothetical protein
VVDDESNVIRVYDARRGGAPLDEIDLSGALAASGRAAKREADLEAGTPSGELAFWIGSHGVSRKGKRKLERHVLFATTRERFEPFGQVYRTLLDDLARDARYAALGLTVAARADREQGANVEGIAERTEGGLWIGFRSPRPGARALLAALENPREVVEGSRARFAEPALLELGGRGIRDIVRVSDGYLIAAGAAGDAAMSKLYRWDGRATPRALPHDVAWLTVEAIVTAQGGEILLLSDDGREPRGDVECKRAPRSAQAFRGAWLKLGP